MKKISTKENGVYSLGLDNGIVAVVLEGILKLYSTEERIIVQKMKITEINKVTKWLNSQRYGQRIDLIKSGWYYLDYFVFKVTDEEVTFYDTKEAETLLRGQRQALSRASLFYMCDMHAVYLSGLLKKNII